MFQLLARQRGHRHRLARPPSHFDECLSFWRASVGTDTREPVHVEPCAWRRAPAWKAAPAPRNLDLTARTYLDARTASLDAHPSPQNAISKDHLCHIPIAKGKGTARHASTRPASTRRRMTIGAPPPSFRRHLVSRPHTASPRLASPARTHARTNETNTISRLDSPPNLRYLCTHTHMHSRIYV